MRHRVVTRVVLALVGVLLAAALGLAWHHAGGTPSGTTGPRPAGAVPDGFERHCADCHAPEELAALLSAAADRAAALLDLLALLAEHGEADAAQDLEIARWLHGLAGEREPVRGR